MHRVDEVIIVYNECTNLKLMSNICA